MTLKVWGPSRSETSTPRSEANRNCVALGGARRARVVVVVVVQDLSRTPKGGPAGPVIRTARSGDDIAATATADRKKERIVATATAELQRSGYIVRTL